MGVIVVQAGAGRRVAATEPEQAREALATIEKTGREALTEMRRLLGVLRSETSPGREPQPGLDHVGRGTIMLAGVHGATEKRRTGG
jgi:signal transduction histidine kinase